ncbi:MAG: hypothetical protein QM811_25365 [Pirellulales bacterium]
MPTNDHDAMTIDQAAAARPLPEHVDYGAPNRGPEFWTTLPPVERACSRRSCAVPTPSRCWASP